MDDKSIVALYWQRSEKAISETHHKYGGYCFRIAYNVLTNHEDAEESVSDTYLTAWNQLPPHRPSVLGVFLGKITRNISISRWRSRSAQKRGGGTIILALEELEECLDGSPSAESQCISRETIQVFNKLLDSLPKEERIVFLRRYWRLDSIEEISSALGFSQSKVKSMLHRTRNKLRMRLAEEGIL